MVLAVVLATLRRLPHFGEAQRQGRWDPMEADDLRDKRVLIIGAGDLGDDLRGGGEALRDGLPLLVLEHVVDDEGGVGDDAPALGADRERLAVDVGDGATLGRDRADGEAAVEGGGGDRGGA